MKSEYLTVQMMRVQIPKRDGTPRTTRNIYQWINRGEKIIYKGCEYVPEKTVAGWLFRVLKAE